MKTAQLCCIGYSFRFHSSRSPLWSF